MKNILLLLLPFCFLICSQKSESTYPKHDFRSPVDGPLHLSGSFGELRSNHFHAGIDIKSQRGRSGDPLYVCADGFVSRIKIEGGGYGNGLYIEHPNGYTTVYAHLQAYAPEIADYVKAKQYEKQAFELDIKLPPDALPVRRGDVIGKMGTSGHSFGPHLHFEIRDTKTEQAINPLLFGFELPDRKAPIVNALKIYHLSQPLFRTLRTENQAIYKSGGKYRVKGDTLNLKTRFVGFGVKAYDLMPFVSNWNGVYAIRTYVDGELVHAFEMNKFEFREGRYINAHIDYAEEFGKKSFYNRTFAFPGNHFSAIEAKQSGVIELHELKSQKVEIICTDISGNESRLLFWVKRHPETLPHPAISYQYKLPYDEDNLIKTEALHLFLPKGCLYRTLFMQYHASDDRSGDIYSQVHHIHNDYTPTHAYYKIGIAARQLPDSLREKAFVAYCSSKGKIWNCGGEWKDGFLETRVRDFGDFCIMADTKAPTIKLLSHSGHLRPGRNIRFEVRDNFRTTRKAKKLEWEVSIDDQWVLASYDAKNHLLRIAPTDLPDLPRGEHAFRLQLSDAVGNVSIYENKIIY